MQTLQAQNKRLTLQLLAVVAGMFVFAVGVLPPLYDVLCTVTGLNGKTARTSATLTGVVAQPERSLEIQFIADTGTGMAWEFQPMQYHLEVHPGEPNLVKYRVRNLSEKVLFSQAVPSVSPAQATPYFKKIQCFCFEKQKLEGNAEKEMPVVFYIDPNIPKDIGTITLSYTLYPLDEKITTAQNNY